MMERFIRRIQNQGRFHEIVSGLNNPDNNRKFSSAGNLLRFLREPGTEGFQIDIFEIARNHFRNRYVDPNNLQLNPLDSAYLSVLLESRSRYIARDPGLETHYNWRVNALSAYGVHLDGANLTGQNLSRLNLLSATFRGANLTRADLSKTNLSGVNFSGVNLSNVNFTGANLTSADFSGANLENASFQGTYILGSKGIDVGDLIRRGAINEKPWEPDYMGAS